MPKKSSGEEGSVNTQYRASTGVILSGLPPQKPIYAQHVPDNVPLPPWYVRLWPFRLFTYYHGQEAWKWNLYYCLERARLSGATFRQLNSIRRDFQPRLNSKIATQVVNMMKNIDLNHLIFTNMHKTILKTLNTYSRRKKH